jgi:hypothetical protein
MIQQEKLQAGKMALEAWEFGKRALALNICCPTICITLGKRNQTSTSINLVLAMKPGGSKSYFARVFHDLACIIDLLTALEASLTYNDLPLIRHTAESSNILTLEILTNI